MRTRARGEFAITTDGRYVTFTPARGFSGSTSVNYSISDGSHPDEAKLTVAFRPEGENYAPEASPDVARIEAGKSIEINVLANDVDRDGDWIGIDADSFADQNLDLTVTRQRTILLRAPDIGGVKTFTYTITDAFGETSIPATVSVIVLEKGEQRPPIAVPDVVFVSPNVRTVGCSHCPTTATPNLDPLTIPPLGDDVDGISTEIVSDGTELAITATQSGTLVYRAQEGGRGRVVQPGG